ncbi:MAG: alpha-L-fucosidase [Lentisphaeria bacterium]|nr:alpha-L-fucosidase [Lentisphaeria bacterium]
MQKVNPMIKNLVYCLTLLPFLSLTVFETKAAEPQGAPKPFGAVPSAHQLAWQETEWNMFVHFGMNTFTDKEWGTGKEKPEWFNPTSVDCRQWAKLAKEVGMKGIVITAKHHDGFCLWPSQYTEHSVKNSPWKNGKGDILRELSNACKEFGLNFGVYLSPWDMHEKTFGSDAYNTFYKNQLTEVLTQYGKVFELWHDGAGSDKQNFDWDSIYALTRKHQPEVIIFGHQGPDARWGGSEHGASTPSHWHTLNVFGGITKGVSPLSPAELQLGCKGGKYWTPAEHDNSIRTRWFYHKRDDHNSHSLTKLTNMYHNLIGSSGVWLWNFSPDKTGKIPQEDYNRALELGNRIKAIYKVNYIKESTVTSNEIRGNLPAFSPANLVDGDKNSYWTTDDGVTKATVVFDLGKAKTFDRMVLKEYIKLGQRIEEFVIEAMLDGNWKQVGKSTTIGYKRIVVFKNHVTTNKVRLRILKSLASPVLSECGLYLNSTVFKEPEISRFADGSVQIKCLPELIYEYAVSKTLPVKSWKPYTKPIAMPVGGTLHVKVTAGPECSYKLPKKEVLLRRVFGMANLNWKILSVDSQETLKEDGRAINAIDGDPKTKWLTQWSEKKPNHPHHIAIDLGKMVKVSGFSYLPRTDARTGHVECYEFYVSVDGKNWGQPVSKGRFDNMKNSPHQRDIKCDYIRKARYIKFVSTAGVDGKSVADAAEIGVFIAD